MLPAKNCLRNCENLNLTPYLAYMGAKVSRVNEEAELCLSIEVKGR